MECVTTEAQNPEVMKLITSPACPVGSAVIQLRCLKYLHSFIYLPEVA